MQVVPHTFEHPGDHAEFRRLPGRGGVELYRARLVHHAFEPHAHAAYGVGVIDAGVERFRYAGAEHLAPTDSLVLMNPDALHTGRAGADGGWRYRMIYLDPETLADISGEPGWWFDDAVVDGDPGRARRLSTLLGGLWAAREPLAFDSLLHRLVSELRPLARTANPPRKAQAMRFEPVLDFMRAHHADRLTLEALAGIAGLSPFHFLRSFQAQHHASPQQVLMAIRLLEAKRLLGAGTPPAQVAAATGLADQAHLTRAFASRYGVTPARYQRQVRG